MLDTQGPPAALSRQGPRRLCADGLVTAARIASARARPERQQTWEQPGARAGRVAAFTQPVYHLSFSAASRSRLQTAFIPCAGSK